ncbi:hypothetical protein [Streptomyces sp. H51]|uniref:hypothetical protein n=1 Tax=Streptomyces sp. H51 TaxID=3111770 RepID=UPI002D7782D9|nr:hypothetical protein [Streptomyces sp. H51]
MAETDWKKVAAYLRELSGEFTPAQRDLAAALGMPLAPGTTMPVAAALLRAHLTGPLRLRRAQPIDEEEYKYLELVAGEAAIKVPPQNLIDHRDILEAWLEVVWAHRSVIHLERLSPEPGDIAIAPGRRGSDQVQHDIIASSTGRSARRSLTGGTVGPGSQRRVSAGTSSGRIRCQRARWRQRPAPSRATRAVSGIRSRSISLPCGPRSRM